MRSQVSKEVKGFTLIELLVVIAIVAILFAAVVVTLNPAELLKQSRDSNRISDLATIKSAISLYLVDVSNPSLGTTTPATCYVHASSGVTSASCGNRFSNTTATSSRSSRAVDGNGWIPVNFSAISSGSPISVLPVDPVNNSTYYYAYAPGSNLTFEINANMESTKYSNGGGSSDVESSDGGNSPDLYEVGTDPGLDL